METLTGVAVVARAWSHFWHTVVQSGRPGTDRALLDTVACAPQLHNVGAIMNVGDAGEAPHWMQTVPLSGSSSIFKHLDESPQADQRRHRRVPRSVGIIVQPLDDSLEESASSFFAITRDVGHGGLAYLSSRPADFQIAVVHMEDEGWSGEVVCRVCNTALVHESEIEKVYLTNLEYLYERFM